MKQVSRLKLWLPVIGWGGVIFAFSGMSIKETVEFYWLDFIIKKTVHVVEYAILYFLFHRAISKKGENKKTSLLISSFIFTLIYAISDEWHQTFISGRHGTLKDIGFDSLGMLLSWRYIKRKL